MQVLFHISHFVVIFLLHLHCVNLCTPCDRKKEADILYNILFTLLKRGVKINTVRLVSVSVHDIYSSAFLSRTSFVFILSPLRLPNIILCHSRRENLIALTNNVSRDRQQLRGMMLHKDSGRADTTKTIM